MKIWSNVLFWVEVIINVLVMTMLSSMNEFDGSMQCEIFSFSIVIALLIAVPVRLINQKDRPVLTGIVTMICSFGPFGILSGIFLIASTRKENVFGVRDENMLRKEELRIDKKLYYQS